MALATRQVVHSADLPNIVRKLRPDPMMDWSEVAVPILGFVATATKDASYNIAAEWMIVDDVCQALGRNDRETVQSLKDSLIFGLAANRLGLDEGEAYTAVIRTILIAGRIIDCYEHTQAYLQETARRRVGDVADPPRFPLEERFPSLTRWVDATILRSAWRCIDAVGKTIGLLEDSEKVKDGLKLGIRYTALWRALDLTNEAEGEAAKKYALYYAALIGRHGQPFLQRVTTWMKEEFGKQFPAINLVNNDLIEKVWGLTDQFYKYKQEK